MLLSKEQLSSVMAKHSERENGLHDLMEIMIESMMLAERREFLDYAEGNKGNGFRHGRAFGQGRVLEFRIPRDRYGNFHPKILALLRDQEMECERLAGILYCKGLTQSQVGDIFEEVYGSHYSKASISRMIDYLRSDVEKWLSRSLESYYPIVFVDAVHVKVHRKRSVATEAFYVVLGVKEDKKREVLGIYNHPAESATGWEGIFRDLLERGMESVGLMVSDGLAGLDTALSVVYPKAQLQRCVTHLKRNMLSKVRQMDIDGSVFYPLNKRTTPAQWSEYLKPLKAGHDVGIISEAGCPGVADPGAEVVKLAHQAGIEVVPMVGPSSILLAMMASGMNGQSFAFVGYIPIKKDERLKTLRQLESRSRNEQQAQLFIETPFRNNHLAQDILQACAPTTRLCIACNLTLPDAYVVTKTIAQWKGKLPELHKKPTIFIIQA